MVWAEGLSPLAILVPLSFSSTGSVAEKGPYLIDSRVELILTERDEPLAVIHEHLRSGGAGAFEVRTMISPLYLSFRRADTCTCIRRRNAR